MLFVVYVLMLALDWSMRFLRYEWQRSWWSAPAVTMSGAGGAKTENPFFRTNQIAALKGGDLTAMLGVEAAKLPYLESRLPGIQIHDRFGYPNREYDPEKPFDVVVVGDSFAGVGHVDQLFASQLADLSGLSVYNMGVMGHGAFIGLERFLYDKRFTRHPPRYLVWAFAQREISGNYFQRFHARLKREQAVEVKGGSNSDRPANSRGRVDWRELSPSRLKKSLTETSIAAQGSQWIWNRVRFYAFQQISPWIVAAEGLVGDGPMLFYHYHIETLKWPEIVRDVPTVSEVISEVAMVCSGRGIELIVVLIPEKEEVYRDWIPASFQPEAGVWPPSPLAPLAEMLNNQGVKTINLLPVFQQATQNGRIVYWRDDTHWNPDGAGLAASTLVGVLTGSTQ